MKQFFRSLLFVAAAATLFTACSKDTDPDPGEKPAAPSMVWENNDLEAVHEITDEMSVEIKILTPGALQKLSLEIDSPVLTPEFLKTVGLDAKMELSNPATKAMEDALKDLNLPAGKEIVGTAQQMFDISELVPLIKLLSEDDSEHRFKVTVTDKYNQSITKTLRFHLSEGPSVTWEGQDINAVHEIADEMSIIIKIAIPAKLEKLELGIVSPVLSQELLAELGLSTQMDLTNPSSAKMEETLKELGLPVGTALKGVQEQLFDISKLVPMIKLLSQEDSNHNFNLKVTDKSGNVIEQSLKFHLSAPASIAYNNDADLWANTATVTVENLPADGQVKYRIKGGGANDWQQATLVAGTDNKFSIAPVWEKTKNAAQLDVFAVKAGTGIFAATTYECGVIKGTSVVATKEFTTGKGDAIPNGNMSGWSQKDMLDASDKVYKITYPNPSGMSVWDSGNNIFLENPASLPFTPLCFENTAEPGTASLMARMVLSFVFAPGNLFVGDFVYSGMSGSANFGKAYTWTARPRALKVRYKAQVGKIDKTGSYDPEAEAYDGQQDRSRIYVAVVDWNAQHGVASGMIEPTGMWDPATATSVAEGNILGYGDLVITESKNGWVEALLPINWYVEKAAKPASDKISLVISCATSFRGDYLTGCSTNTMNVDDFEWVY